MVEIYKSLLDGRLHDSKAIELSMDSGNWYVYRKKTW